MASYRRKEEILKLTWQKRGFEYLGNSINLDHDYAPVVLKQRREYAEVKSGSKPHSQQRWQSFIRRELCYMARWRRRLATWQRGDFRERSSNAQRIYWSRSDVYRGTQREKRRDRWIRIGPGTTRKDSERSGAKSRTDYRTLRDWNLKGTGYFILFIFVLFIYLFIIHYYYYYFIFIHLYLFIWFYFYFIYLYLFFYFIYLLFIYFFHFVF